MSLTGFWLESNNLTKITGLANALTSALLTSDDVTSITAVLLDANDQEVSGDAITFSYDEAGEWHAVWSRTMTEGSFYTLKITVIADIGTLIVTQYLPARYKGPDR